MVLPLADGHAIDMHRDRDATAAELARWNPEFRLPSGEVLVGWPSHRLPIDGLYQTGATAHPDGSVSGRAGRNTARVLLADLGIDPATVMGAGG